MFYFSHLLHTELFHEKGLTHRSHHPYVDLTDDEWIVGHKIMGAAAKGRIEIVPEQFTTLASRLR